MSAEVCHVVDLEETLEEPIEPISRYEVMDAIQQYHALRSPEVKSLIKETMSPIPWLPPSPDHRPAETPL